MEPAWVSRSPVRLSNHMVAVCGRRPTPGAARLSASRSRTTPQSSSSTRPAGTADSMLICLDTRTPSDRTGALHQTCTRSNPQSGALIGLVNRLDAHKVHTTEFERTLNLKLRRPPNDRAREPETEQAYTGSTFM